MSGHTTTREEATLVQRRQLLQDLATAQQVEFVDLAAMDLDREMGRILPETLSQKIQGLCVGKKSAGELLLGVKDTSLVYIFDHVRYASAGRYCATLALADPALVDLAIAWTWSDEPIRWLEYLDLHRLSAEALVSVGPVPEHAAPDVSDKPVVRAVDTMLKEAISVGASDIHLEPYEKETVVRYRVDGFLHDISRLARDQASAYLKRVKVMAGMDLTQSTTPQSGRMSLRVGEMEIDIRVSTMPAHYGESGVLRIQRRTMLVTTLSDLGFGPHSLGLYQEMIESPSGILLVSGPTGSGKTTTLYSTLIKLKRPGIKIVTIEDPIEYTLDGIVQVQVNIAPHDEERRLTFARALRGFLRQDPDVILVGEIRDDDTAEVAVQAALTGHLVVTTIHATSTVGSVIRLFEHGIRPFLVSSTARGAVAQRLVRTLCPRCRVPATPTVDVAEMYEKSGMPVPDQIMTPRGCIACRNLGFRGRHGLFEVLSMTPEMRAAIGSMASAASLWEVARRDGVRSLFEEGLTRVAEGLTTMEEVYRACRAVD